MQATIHYNIPETLQVTNRPDQRYGTKQKTTYYIYPDMVTIGGVLKFTTGRKQWMATPNLRNTSHRNNFYYLTRYTNMSHIKARIFAHNIYKCKIILEENTSNIAINSYHITIIYRDPFEIVWGELKEELLS